MDGFLYVCQVYATDISAAMVKEAAQRASQQLGKAASLTKFETSDLEDLKGSYDTVTCVDVMIHYPTDKVRRKALMINLRQLLVLSMVTHHGDDTVSSL